MTLIDIVRQHAASNPDKIAVVCDNENLTYAQLLEQAEAEALRLRNEEGVLRGDIYQFKATQDIAYLVRFLAVHIVGAICTPVDEYLPLPSFHNETVCDMLFTTGSTSAPKGVLLSEEAIMADAENLIEAHGYQHDLTFVICGPIHHFGSWSKVLPTLVSGATLYLLEGLKDTEALFEALASSRKTATFLVPSAIRMLMQLNRKRLEELAGNIDFIETGAAPIAVADMEQLRAILPNTRLYNTYASTETGVVCTYPFHGSKPCLSGCVGPTMKHANIHLDSEGHIVVQGRMIMSGYLHEAVEADVLSAQSAGWTHPDEIVTSDMGMIDAQGNLFIMGRDSDFINVGGLKVAPAEVENVVMALPEINDCICVAAPHQMMGQVPKLLVVMKSGCLFNKRAIINYLKAHLETYKIPLQYEEVTEIRKTFNGKKDRKAYRTSDRFAYRSCRFPSV